VNLESRKAEAKTFLMIIIVSKCHTKNVRRDEEVETYCLIYPRVGRILVTLKMFAIKVEEH
jgi:hypothetical protein